MQITKEDADRLVELRVSIQEQLDEFIQICRSAMTGSEFERFRYNCLAHVEPGISRDQPWFTPYAKSLEDIVEMALEEAEEEINEDEEDEEV
jgi:hypothetical protein